MDRLRGRRKARLLLLLLLLLLLPAQERDVARVDGKKCRDFIPHVAGESVTKTLCGTVRLPAVTARDVSLQLFVVKLL